MNRACPLVLIAGVSPHERRSVESSLSETGYTTRAVNDAEHAATEFVANGTSCVLVIDSGLLEADHDPQWRSLRADHPRLGAVVRCLVPGANGRRYEEDRTVFVHPDDQQAMQRAVRVLCRAE